MKEHDKLYNSLKKALAGHYANFLKELGVKNINDVKPFDPHITSKLPELLPKYAALQEADFDFYHNQCTDASTRLKMIKLKADAYIAVSTVLDKLSGNPGDTANTGA